MSTAALAAAVAVWVALAAHTIVTDLRMRVIRRHACWGAATAIAALYSLAAIASGTPRHLLTVVIGVGAVVAFTELFWRARPHSIGYGDIRLINTNSLLLAWWGPAWQWFALTVAAAAATPHAVAARRDHGSRAAIPFAPALAVGTAVCLAAQFVTAS